MPHEGPSDVGIGTRWKSADFFYETGGTIFGLRQVLGRPSDVYQAVHCPRRRGVLAGILAFVWPQNESRGFGGADRVGTFYTCGIVLINVNRRPDVFTPPLCFD